MTDINVLMIDDETAFIRPVAKRLTRRGMNVFQTSEGAKALRVLEQVEIDVVLLDIRMPGMDGVKTLGEIKRLHPYVEVVMLTSHGSTDVVISSLAMGAFDYLLKPVGIEALVAKIRGAHARRCANLEIQPGTRGTNANQPIKDKRG